MARYCSKITNFNLLHMYLAPLMKVTPLEFHQDLWRQNTGVAGPLCSVLCITTSLAILIAIWLVTDRQDRATAHTTLAERHEAKTRRWRELTFEASICTTLCVSAVAGETGTAVKTLQQHQTSNNHHWRFACSTINYFSVVLLLLSVVVWLSFFSRTLGFPQNLWDNCRKSCSVLQVPVQSPSNSVNALDGTKRTDANHSKSLTFLDASTDSSRKTSHQLSNATIQLYNCTHTHVDTGLTAICEVNLN